MRKFDVLNTRWRQAPILHWRSRCLRLSSLKGFSIESEWVVHPPIPILAGIFTLASYRNAEFLNNEVPGMVVPRSILDRMRRADTGEKARAEGLKIAQEMLLEARHLVQGVQITVPLGRYAMAVEVAEALRRPVVPHS